MNNIRKIIEERLENAKNEYQLIADFKGSNKPKNILAGQIEAYQDCLNLIPAPRTEQDVLNEFEKLGYKVNKNFSHIILLHENGDEIKIWFNDKSYSSSIGINMQEHKLLNELFEVIF